MNTKLEDFFEWPDEIVYMIFSYLSPKDFINMWLAGNKRLQAVLNDIVFKNKVNFYKAQEEFLTAIMRVKSPDDNAIKYLLQKFLAYVQDYDVSIDAKMNFIKLIGIIKNSPFTKEVVKEIEKCKSLELDSSDNFIRFTLNAYEQKEIIEIVNHLSNNIEKIDFETEAMLERLYQVAPRKIMEEFRQNTIQSSKLSDKDKNFINSLFSKPSNDSQDNLNPLLNTNLSHEENFQFFVNKIQADQNIISTFDWENVEDFLLSLKKEESMELRSYFIENINEKNIISSERHQDRNNKVSYYYDQKFNLSIQILKKIHPLIEKEKQLKISTLLLDLANNSHTRFPDYCFKIARFFDKKIIVDSSKKTLDSLNNETLSDLFNFLILLIPAMEKYDRIFLLEKLNSFSLCGDTDEYVDVKHDIICVWMALIPFLDKENQEIAILKFAKRIPELVKYAEEDFSKYYCFSEPFIDGYDSFYYRKVLKIVAKKVSSANEDLLRAIIEIVKAFAHHESLFEDSYSILLSIFLNDPHNNNNKDCLSDDCLGQVMSPLFLDWAERIMPKPQNIIDLKDKQYIDDASDAISRPSIHTLFGGLPPAKKQKMDEESSLKPETP